MITQPQTLYGIVDSPVGLAAWMLNHDASSYSDIADAVARAPRRQPDPGRGPEQRHVLLADEHRHFLGPAVLGEHVRLLRRPQRQHPGRRIRLPQGDLPGPAQLGREGLPQACLLQRGRPGLPLRRLAGADAVHRRAPRRVPVTALDHGSDVCTCPRSAVPSGSTPGRSAPPHGTPHQRRDQPSQRLKELS